MLNHVKMLTSKRTKTEWQVQCMGKVNTFQNGRYEKNDESNSSTPFLNSSVINKSHFKQKLFREMVTDQQNSCKI